MMTPLRIILLILLGLIALSLALILGVWGFLFTLFVGATGFTVAFVLARSR